MSQEQEQEQQTKSEEPKTFTQEDVDKLIGERLARAKSTPPQDYEELKAKAAKLEEIEAAQLSEVDRLKKEREELAAQAAKAQSDLQESRIESKVTSVAAMKGAVDPEAVLRLIDRKQITLGDDGQVSGVEEAVTALLAEKPYLVGKTTPKGGLDGGVRNTADAPDPSSMQMDEYVKARKAGRI